MKIILREAVDNLGRAGDVVQVRDGYARNFLLPRKIAYLATPGNLKVMEQERAKLLRREAQQRDEAEKLRAALNGVEIVVARRSGEQDVLYGSVTNADLAEELAKQGFTVDKRRIGLDEHIKRLGEYEVPIRLFTDVVAQVKLRVLPENAPAEAAPAAESEAEA